jgi:hypothetical protein
MGSCGSLRWTSAARYTAIRLSYQFMEPTATNEAMQTTKEQEATATKVKIKSEQTT